MENNCFPPSRRVKKPAEFKVVYSQNQTRVKGQYFTVLAFSRFRETSKPLINNNISKTLFAERLGVVVSKKVTKLAVGRNRLKRLMRESFRNRQHPAGFDFVVIARPGGEKIDNNKLSLELDKLWKRLHQRCNAL